MDRKKQKNDIVKKSGKPDMQKKQGRSKNGQNPVAQREGKKIKLTVQKNAANRKADVDFTLQKKKYKKCIFNQVISHCCNNDIINVSINKFCK